MVSDSVIGNTRHSKEGAEWLCFFFSSSSSFFFPLPPSAEELWSSYMPHRPLLFAILHCAYKPEDGGGSDS